MIDLNHESGFVYGATIPRLSIRVNALIDRALVAQHEAQPRRTYLGGSRIGEACSRRLVYEYTHTPHDPDKAFSGQTLTTVTAYLPCGLSHRAWTVRQRRIHRWRQAV